MNQWPQPISPNNQMVKPLIPGMIQERSPLTVLLLSFVTCGIYAIYWLFKTSDELRLATQDESINPTTDLLLVLVTCGIWGIYVEYRNSQKIHQILSQTEPGRKDQSQTILILNIAMYFVGVTGLIATYILQEEMNQLANKR